MALLGVLERSGLIDNDQGPVFLIPEPLLMGELLFLSFEWEALEVPSGGLASPLSVQ